MKAYEFSCRAFQKIMRAAQNLWPWGEPKLLRGPGSAGGLSAFIKSLGLRRVLLVTDPGLMQLGLPRPLIRGLEKAGLFCAVYDKTAANPTTDNVEEARWLYREAQCDCIVAFGGGSPMDCAKMAGLLSAYPRKKAHRMKGVQPVRLRKAPPLFAVPTTAGSGSEATIAAVVSDPVTHAKRTVLSPRLRPKYAVLDPALTLGLPPRFTAQTGMDALTHAVEAYLSQGHTKKTDARALEAVRLIFDNLQAAHADGRDTAARDAMLYAAFCAGSAFTRAYVGYAHAISHVLGGMYDIQHGLACAVALPHVLAAYGEAARPRLADLYDAAGLSSPEQSVTEKAGAFIHTLRILNTSLGLPARFTCIREDDIPEIAARALKESNPLYPVPRIWRQAEFEGVVREMRKEVA
ncbi:MAG: iron-containing alcohol dehydrogenase [Firmicutes bacterium]|nr:iron-containing alcohol dehydrogenase [Bacillota bacterium]